jgi:hypothetical protein
MGKIDDAPDTLPTARCEYGDNFWFPHGLLLYVAAHKGRGESQNMHSLTPGGGISMLKKRDEVDRTFGGWVRGCLCRGRATPGPLLWMRAAPLHTKQSRRTLLFNHQPPR